MHISKTNPSSLPLVWWQHSEKIAGRRGCRKEPNDLTAPGRKNPKLSSRCVKHSNYFIYQKKYWEFWP